MFEHGDRVISANGYYATVLGEVCQIWDQARGRVAREEGRRYFVVEFDQAVYLGQPQHTVRADRLTRTIVPPDPSDINAVVEFLTSEQPEEQSAPAGQ